MTQPISPKCDRASPSLLPEVIPQIWQRGNGKRVIWVDMIFSQKEEMLEFWEIFRNALDANNHQFMQLPSMHANSDKGCMRIICDAKESYSMLVLIFQHFPSLNSDSLFKVLNPSTKTE